MAPTTDSGAGTSRGTATNVVAAATTAGLTERKPFKGLSSEWQDFGLCMMFHLLFPLLPIGVEYFATGSITGPSVTMASAMYVIAVGTSSRSKLMFGVCVVLCCLFSVTYGILLRSPQPNAPPGSGNPALVWSSVALFGIFVIHSLERYNRHVVDRTPYWEFAERKG